MTDDTRHDGDADVVRSSGSTISPDFEYAGRDRGQPVSVDLITEAMAEAWEEALRRLGGPPNDPQPLWMLLAKRVLAAAGEGERDAQRLKRASRCDRGCDSGDY